MSYKRLGDYIRIVNNRNIDLEVKTLLGVSIKKVLMPSIANTIGTNMKNYKIIKQNQFAYGPVTSRNGDKISIALLDEYDKAIVSQAYTVFEIIDKDELDPEYLMMWFRRPEFDRYARFKSHGSARETFDWEEMCDVELPIPSIEKQKEIVAEYNTVTNRIALNEQLNQKLEETAQALYKHWFVDFEFPNQEGKPYKSSGGKMVYNEELDKDIPEGWEVKQVKDVFNIQIGRTPPRDEKKWFTINGNGVKWISIKDLGENGVYVLKTSEELTNDAVKFFKIPTIPENTTILSFKMSVGKVGITTEKMLSNEAIAHFSPNNKSFNNPEYIYCYLKYFNFNSLGTTSSIVNSINSRLIKELDLIIPNKEKVCKFNNLIKPIFYKILLVEKYNIKLSELASMLLGKMSR